MSHLRVASDQPTNPDLESRDNHLKFLIEEQLQSLSAMVLTMRRWQCGKRTIAPPSELASRLRADLPDSGAHQHGTKSKTPSAHGDSAASSLCGNSSLDLVRSTQSGWERGNRLGCVFKGIYRHVHTPFPHEAEDTVLWFVLGRTQNVDCM